MGHRHDPLTRQAQAVVDDFIAGVEAELDRLHALDEATDQWRSLGAALLAGGATGSGWG